MGTLAWVNCTVSQSTKTVKEEKKQRTQVYLVVAVTCDVKLLLCTTNNPRSIAH